MTAGLGEVPGSPPSLPRATWRELLRRTLVAAGRERSSAADRDWVESILTGPELDLWIRQSAFDQDHVLQVARRVERRLAATVHAGDARWLGAALMHDVGKVEARLSMLGRAAATIAGRIVSRETARRWASGAPGFRRRIGAYLTHGEIGARMIRRAGGRGEAAAWSEAHQDLRLAPSGLGFPADVVEALSESDVA